MHGQFYVWNVVCMGSMHGPHVCMVRDPTAVAPLLLVLRLGFGSRLQFSLLGGVCCEGGIWGGHGGLVAVSGARCSPAPPIPHRDECVYIQLLFAAR